MILASYLVFDKGSQMPWKDLMGLLVWALGGPEFSVQGSSLPVFPGTAAKAFRKSILATKGKASPALVSQFLRRARRVATDARSRILGIKNAPLYYGQRSRQAGDPIKYLAFREQILPETTLRALSMAFGGRPAEYEHLRDPVSTEVRQNLRGDELAPFWVNPNSGTLSLIKPSGFLQRDLSKPAEGWMALKGRWEEAEVSKGKLTVTPSAEEEVDPEDLEPLAAHLAAEAPDSVIFKVPASYNSVVQVEYEPAVDYTVVYMQSLGVFDPGAAEEEDDEEVDSPAVESPAPAKVPFASCVQLCLHISFSQGKGKAKASAGSSPPAVKNPPSAAEVQAAAEADFAKAAQALEVARSAAAAQAAAEADRLKVEKAAAEAAASAEAKAAAEAAAAAVREKQAASARAELEDMEKADAKMDQEGETEVEEEVPDPFALEVLL
eukprot:NODE_982_length_1634_cov_48.384227_g810_i0.p1 GENE.NODE_982_length_1634_cov_48.384227_g810_i0~~NODE_982_length_1634_cov_48.384227_g810_i0.p1  ORF type:complete len:464 (-),score=117.59 NODE_982_length_1634_cov_48.384227_g810_i0:242-1555(-)